MKALICVDVQKDFLPGGALGVPEGDQVIPVLIDEMDNYDVIVLSRDWHPEDHTSFDKGEPEYHDYSWPPHCVQGTKGAEFDVKLHRAAVETGKPVLIVHKGFKRDVEEYSAVFGIVEDAFNLPDGCRVEEFNGRPLHSALVYLGVESIGVGGLALDYCVAATTSDFASVFDFDIPTTLLVDATRPVSTKGGYQAIHDLTLHPGVRFQW